MNPLPYAVLVRCLVVCLLHPALRFLAHSGCLLDCLREHRLIPSSRQQHLSPRISSTFPRLLLTSLGLPQRPWADGVLVDAMDLNGFVHWSYLNSSGPGPLVQSSSIIAQLCSVGGYGCRASVISLVPEYSSSPISSIACDDVKGGPSSASLLLHWFSSALQVFADLRLQPTLPRALYSPRQYSKYKGPEQSGHLRPSSTVGAGIADCWRRPRPLPRIQVVVQAHVDLPRQF